MIMKIETVRSRFKSLPIPAIYDDILDLVKQVSPAAIIAGGAVRDLDHQLAARDIDIFIPTPNTKDVGLAVNNIEALIEEELIAKSESIDEYVEQSNNIRGVYDFTYYGTPIQLVCFKTHETDQKKFAKIVLNSFDFGLNRVAYLGTKKFVITKEYVFDRENDFMTLCLVRRPVHLVKLIKKYERLQDKLGEKQLQYKKNAFKGAIT